MRVTYLRVWASVRALLVLGDERCALRLGTKRRGVLIRCTDGKRSRQSLDRALSCVQGETTCFPCHFVESGRT
jgi:hypothetical protein